MFSPESLCLFDSLEITFHESKRPQFTTLPGTLHLPDSRRHISACRAEYCLRNFPSLYLCSGSHFFLQTMRLLFAGVPYFPASVQMPSGKTPFSAYRLICFPQSQSDLRNEAGKSLCSLQKAGGILHFSDTDRKGIQISAVDFTEMIADIAVCRLFGDPCTKRSLRFMFGGCIGALHAL